MTETTPIMAAPVTREAIPAVSEHTNGAEQSGIKLADGNIVFPFADDDAE